MQQENNTNIQNTNAVIPSPKQQLEPQRVVGNGITKNPQITDKITEKLASGGKVLIMDTNGEYTVDQFAKNGLPNFPVKTIGVGDVKAWSRSNLVECRRIDMKSLHIDDKLRILTYVMSVLRTCVIILEDINTITTDINHMKNIVSAIVNLRHKGVDVIISYQSLRAVEPRILTNSRWIRLHYSIGDVEDIKGKVDNMEMTKIAQMIIDRKYANGDERFFLYLYKMPPKIRGNFTEEEFRAACEEYLLINPSKVKKEMRRSKCSEAEAINSLTDIFFRLFYGNNIPAKQDREAGMLVTAAAQGTGKTYQNMYIIARRIKYNPNSPVTISKPGIPSPVK